MCHFLQIKLPTHLVELGTVNFLPATKGLRRWIHIDSLMIKSSELLVRGMAIEHLSLVKIVKFKLGGGFGRKARMMLVRRGVNYETASGTCTLVVVPATAASHILDHKIKMNRTIKPSKFFSFHIKINSLTPSTWIFSFLPESTFYKWIIALQTPSPFWYPLLQWIKNQNKKSPHHKDLFSLSSLRTRYDNKIWNTNIYWSAEKNWRSNWKIVAISTKDW